MKSISIYAITRKQNLAQLSRMERQLSKREKPLKMREWELDSLKNLVDQLESQMPDVCGLRFFCQQHLELGVNALNHLSRRFADGVQRAFQFLGFLAG